MEEKLIELRVYLYDETKLNGLGTELKNVMIGAKISSCLDDTQDTAEITLNGISNSIPYTPLTKFVVVLSQDGCETQYLHYELRYDLVEKLSMSANLYKHSLFLANPAISCQKRTCDNFSISYRLKDVRLDNSSYSDSYKTEVALDNLNGKNTTVCIYKNSLGKAVYGSDRDFSKTSYNEANGAKYFTWHNSVDGSYLSESDLVDPYKLNQAIFINSSKITTNIAKKCKEWIDKLGADFKFQIMDYDSSNSIYGSGSTYENYFEEVDKSFHKDNSISNKTFKYTPPVCLMWQSDCYNQEITTTSDYAITYKSPYKASAYNSHMFVVPTITQIIETNLSTLEETTIAEFKTILNGAFQDKASCKSVDIPYYLDKRSVIKATTSYLKYQPDWIQNRYVLLGFDELTYGDYAKNSIITPIFLDVNNGGSQIMTTFEFEPKANCKYRFITKPYFGTNGVDRYCFMPTDNSGDTIEKTIYNGTALNDNEIITQWRYERKNNEFDLTSVKNNQDAYQYVYEVSFYDISSEPQLLMLKSQSSIPTCYDLFIKSQLAHQPLYYNTSSDKWGKVFTERLPYVVSDGTKALLQSQQVIEDKYYNKNLWEMFMQIGKYIHAKPYIRFYQGKYELAFKQYGIAERSSKKATTNSIFSNYNIESYISSLDSYIENYFEYGNEVEEYIRPTDNDGSSICTNDNAMLKTKYPIEEITYLGFHSTTSNVNTWYDITDYIYEHNIYKCLNILENSNSVIYYHFKGNSIYYHLGEKSIQGFQYCEPNTSGEDVKPYAIKRIIGALLKKSADTIQINDYVFYIKYRTKDDVRFKTFKPDLRKFMVSSSTDNFPVQTQFNNQSDKVVDSSKYGNNVYGTLLRSGNMELEYQEYITNIDTIKDSGELYSINNNLYYIAKSTYAIYPTYVDCQINYTKDFNKLSEIIGIDSAPRFYEIPEDGSIKRNISFDRIFSVCLNEDYNQIKNVGDLESLRRIYNNVVWKYCVIDYRGAYKSYNSETNDFHSNILVPCTEYATANTLTLECDMADNYGAGDRQIDVSSEYQKTYMESSWIIPILNRLNVSYKIDDVGTITERQSVQYCDVYGKADLISFIFLQDIKGYTQDSTTYKIVPYDGYLNLPYGDTNTLLHNLYAKSTSTNNYYVNQKVCGTITQNSSSTKIAQHYYVLDKDARETIGINYSMHLCTGSDQFVLSNNVFRRKRDKSGNDITKYKWFFLSEEVNKYERNTLQASHVLATTDATKDIYGNYIDYYYQALTPNVSGVDLSKVRSIAFGYYADNQYYFIIARNVPINNTDDNKATKWYFRKINSN